MGDAVAKKLKLLRLRSGLSVRKFAAMIGMDHTHYAYFEDPSRFKKQFLEMGLARSVAKVLADYDVDRSEVMALAGVDTADDSPALSAGEEHLIDRFRKMMPEQRLLLLQLAEQMAPVPPTGGAGGALPALDERPLGQDLAQPPHEKAA